MTDAGARAGQGDVDFLSFQASQEFFFEEVVFASCKGVFQPLLNAVGELTQLRAFALVELTHALLEGFEGAFLAQILLSEVLQFLKVAHRLEGFNRFTFEGFQLVFYFE